jgi:hypothetical protein
MCLRCRAHRRKLQADGGDPLAGSRLLAGYHWREELQLLTHVEFRSDRFPPYDGEEEQVNPGLWGKRLAEFLREGLRTAGIATEDPFAEDWGWVLPAVNETFPLWIG